MLRGMLKLCLIGSFSFGLIKCGTQGDNGSTFSMRPMSKQEIEQDFNQIVTTFRDFYGPLEYKEKRFGFDFEALVQETEVRLEQTTNNEEVYGVYAEFLSRFKDGHVGIRFHQYNNQITSFKIDLFLVPLYDDQSDSVQAYVGHAGSGLTDAVGKWDRLVSVDGTPTMDLLPLIQKYKTIGYDYSDNHLIYMALDRPSYATDLQPKSTRAVLVFERQDGSTYTLQPVWEIVKQRQSDFVEESPLGALLVWDGSEDLKAKGRGSLLEMGAEDPFFMTDRVKDTYDVQIVTASDEVLGRYGFTAERPAPYIFSAIYSYQGKNILLVRNSSYHRSVARDGFSNEDYMNHYRAIFEQWDSLVDLVVVDQNHNGGGSYCEDFFALFIQKEQNGFVQRCNADRRWVRSFHEWAEYGGIAETESYLRKSFLEFAKQVEKSIDEDMTLTPPIPMMGGAPLRAPDKLYQWKKPVLVLVDELAGSCADAFPMLIKNNQVGKLFGSRTMGLGGNVESMRELNISGATVRLTRGLFTSFDPSGVYPENQMIENNGVEVDYPYTVGIRDVKDGFVNYFQAFSDSALEQLQVHESPAEE